jgi:hypothetical protein
MSQLARFALIDVVLPTILGWKDALTKKPPFWPVYTPVERVNM